MLCEGVLMSCFICLDIPKEQRIVDAPEGRPLYLDAQATTPLVSIN